MPPYQYIILHESCRNRIGVAASQTAHAARESVRELPHDSETHVAILMADSSDALVAISMELKVAGIYHVLICEPDPPYNGSAVALGIEPMERDRIRSLPYIANLKSFRERPRPGEGKPTPDRHAPVAQAAPAIKPEDPGENPGGRSNHPAGCSGPWPA